jgi:hypothetical protein
MSGKYMGTQYEITDQPGDLIDWDEAHGEIAEDEAETYNHYCNDCMDGDAETALASVGWGTDEDYGGCQGDNYWED